MRRPEEHRYPQSFEVQVGNQRGICPVLRKSNRRRSRVSKLFTTGKLNFTKNLQKFIYIKSVYRVLIVKELVC